MDQSGKTGNTLANNAKLPFTGVPEKRDDIGIEETYLKDVTCSSLQFDGTNDWVKIPDSNLTSFTLEAWIRPTGLGGTTNTGSGGITAVPILTKGRGESDAPASLNMNYFLGLDSNNKLVADFEEIDGDNHPVIGNTILSLNVWTHIAATYDSATNFWRLYVNGVLDIAKDLGSNKTPNRLCAQPAAIGTALNSSGTASGYFKGGLDEVRIWDRSRSGAQIAANYNKTISDTATGLVGYYKFNEGAEDQKVYDASPNNRHGLLGATIAVESSDAVRNPNSYPNLTNGCQATQTSHIQKPITLSSIQENGSLIQIFPNPASSNVTIDLQPTLTGRYRLRITDLAGHVVYAKDLILQSRTQHRLQVQLPPQRGLFMVTVEGLKEKKVVKLLRM